MRRAFAVAALVLVGCGHADARGARVERFKVHSQAVGRTLEVQVVLPQGDVAGRPLVVFLHGRGMKPSDFTGDDAVFAGLAALGDRAPILAFPYGGDHSYWHDRADGDWGRYVLREVIPQAIQRTGADRSRVALGGISMGGFGAYDLATRAKRHFCAVGGHSPALWRTGGETAPGAFDDAGLRPPRRDRTGAPPRRDAALARRRRRGSLPGRRPRVQRRRGRPAARVGRRPRQRLLEPALAAVPALLRARLRKVVTHHTLDRCTWHGSLRHAPSHRSAGRVRRDCRACSRSAAPQ
jgi:hypothetical protein